MFVVRSACRPAKRPGTLIIAHSGHLCLQEHNSKEERSHSLSINRFADWHREEFLATMLPNHGKVRPALPLEGKQALMHKPKVPEHMLPTTLDWRGSGADSPVKDQASCGSCWVSNLFAKSMCCHDG